VSGYVFTLIRWSSASPSSTSPIGVATIQGWESGADRWMAVPAGKFLALRNRLRHL